AVAFTLEFYRDGAVGIDRLFTSPRNRLFNSPTSFKQGRQVDHTAVVRWKQKGSLTKCATIGMSSIQRASHPQFLIRTFKLQPQHTRYAGNTAIRDTNDQL